MNKNTKITLEELIRRKEQMLESKKKPKTETLYIKSLDGTITIESPTAAMAREAQDMENGDAYMVYSCVTEPCLKSKELRDAFGCVEPMEIVEKIKEVLEQTPPELVGDILTNGIILTGGGALLGGLPELVSEVVGAPCYVADNPIECVARGVQKAFDYTDELLDGFEKISLYRYK